MRRRRPAAARPLEWLDRLRSLPPPVVAGLLVALLTALAWVRLRGPQDPDLYEPGRTFRVARVVDGDTLLLDGGVRVRLLGVDTPEIHHPDRPVEPLGPEAAAFVRDWVEGEHVRLEFDRERRDRYGRTLAYVYLGDTLLNAEIIRAGFSRAETRFPYSTVKKKLFLRAEQEARQAGRGRWQTGR